jgi:Domain of unknown function (DUF4386)
MNAAVIVAGRRETSPRLMARIAGVCYVMNVALAPGFYANSRCVVPGNAAATATNMLAHEGLYRLGFAGNMVAIAAYLAVTALFYELFRPVSRTVSFLAALFSLVGCALLTVASFFQVAPFVVLGGARYLSVFAVEQVYAIALVILKMYSQCFGVSLVLFGCYCLLIGYLIWNSGFLPRILGAGMALAGLGWLTFLSPPFAQSLSPYIQLSGIGELALTLWLLVAGVDAERWKVQAGASEA